MPVTLKVATITPMAHMNSLKGQLHIEAMCRVLIQLRMVSPLAIPVDIRVASYLPLNASKNTVVEPLDKGKLIIITTLQKFPWVLDIRPESKRR